MNRNNDKIRLSIDIFGSNYKLVGNFSEKYMKQLSTHINANMESIAKSNPKLDSQKVTVLSLIHLTDEYFQLRDKWDIVESERLHTKQHIEELRKAFELSEEKERSKSDEVRSLIERVQLLEQEQARKSQEIELANLTWAEQVEEWKLKYRSALANAQSSTAKIETRIRDLEVELDKRELRIAELDRICNQYRQEQQQHYKPPLKIEDEPITELAADPDLPEKYKKLKEEYIKLKNEFNEWIQLTQSSTQ